MNVFYFKLLDSDGKVVSLLTYDNYHPDIVNPPMVEIDKDEYETLFDEIVDSNTPDADEISDEEALNIILGVSE